MKLLITLCLTILLMACTTMPQTSDEFRDLSKKNPKWYMAESYHVAKSHDQVATAIMNKWNECYSVSRTTKRTSGGATTMRYTDIYIPRTKKRNGSTIELVLQRETQGMIMLDKTPQGGYYVVVLDVISKSGGRTELRWYSTNSWKDEWERNKDWAVGKSNACG